MNAQQGQWAPDPYGRAELRWHDGSAWTANISNGGVQSVEQQVGITGAPAYQVGYSSTPAMGGYSQGVTDVKKRYRTNGMLIAAGVMQILEGILGLLVAAAAFVAGDAINDTAFEGFSGAVTVFGVIFLAMGLSGVLFGAFCCAGKRGSGAIVTIVFQSLLSLLMLLGIVMSIADGTMTVGSLITPIYVFTALTLAILGFRKQTA